MTTTDRPRSTYAFDNSSAESKVQVEQLQEFLDPVTTACLSATGLSPGGRCLELGPGGGSIAHWMAERVGVRGRVTAVDVNPSHVIPAENMTVLRADIRDGVPGGGEFDLIHARLVLLHLPERRAILTALADALAPGGWLVLGEFSSDPPRVIRGMGAADVAVFDKVAKAVRDGMSRHNGVDFAWARQVHAAMLDEGLVAVRSTEHAESWVGGIGGARMCHANTFQLEELTLDAGVTRRELDRYRELVTDPRVHFRSHHFVNTAGRKPK